jgi:hypothetical protein
MKDSAIVFLTLLACLADGHGFCSSGGVGIHQVLASAARGLLLSLAARVASVVNLWF